MPSRIAALHQCLSHGVKFFTYPGGKIVLYCKAHKPITTILEIQLLLTHPICISKLVSFDSQAYQMHRQLLQIHRHFHRFAVSEFNCFSIRLNVNQIRLQNNPPDLTCVKNRCCIHTKTERQISHSLQKRRLHILPTASSVFSTTTANIKN